MLEWSRKVLLADTRSRQKKKIACVPSAWERLSRFGQERFLSCFRKFVMHLLKIAYNWVSTESSLKLYWDSRKGTELMTLQSFIVKISVRNFICRTKRTFYWCMFLGAFAELRKVTVYLRHVCPSVCPLRTSRLPLNGFAWNLAF